MTFIWTRYKEIASRLEEEKSNDGMADQGRYRHVIIEYQSCLEILPTDTAHASSYEFIHARITAVCIVNAHTFTHTVFTLMIANAEKSHAILLGKNQANTSGEKINIDGEIINFKETVKHFGDTLGYKLDFYPNISNSCKKAAALLNALQRRVVHWLYEQRNLVQSFIYSNFKYCPLVWYLSSSASLQHNQKVQDRAPRRLCNNHTSSYNKFFSFRRDINTRCSSFTEEPFAMKY